MLKSSCPFENNNVRPFAVLAYILSEIGEISKSEFTYLLPLAINKEKTERIVNYIKAIRANNATIDEAIISILYEMENYQEAKDIFIKTPSIDELLIQEIGMNRKSRTYDIPYATLYDTLQSFRTNPTNESVIALFNAVDKISGKARLYWKMYLFNSVSRRKIETTVISHLKKNFLNYYTYLKQKVCLMTIMI